MTRVVVIADASSLIALQNIGEIEALAKLFSKINITREVADEYGLELPSWIHIQQASGRSLLRPEISRLDRGEASSIALALDADNPLLVIDEKKGRRVAEQLDIEIIGIVGVLIKARIAGFIEAPETLLARLESVDFRLNAVLRTMLLGADDKIS
jgi:predicted nucleic acid-binding protein